MANKIKEVRRKIKSKIEAIKRAKETAEDDIEKFKDKYEQKALKGAEDLSKTLGDFVSKQSKKIESGLNKKGSVFTDLIDTIEGVLSGKAIKVEPTDKLFTKQRLRQITNESANETLKVATQIMMEGAQKILFAGDGVCGTNTTFGAITSITLKPQEFDFMNILTIPPTTCSGKIVYEPTSPDKGYVKMNRNLYNTFGGTPYTFTSQSGNNLFSLGWDAPNQRYNVSGLGTTNIKTFITDYYSSIEPVDFSGVTKTAIFLTLNGCGDEPPLFDKGWNDLNRLLQKLCALCGNPSNGKISNATTEFNENDEDIQSYFNFDDVEGIDLDDEKDRLDKVLKFRDCNNFKVPINTTHFEDFVDDDGDLNDAVNDALLNAASDAHNQSDGKNPPDNFHLTLLSMFIVNLPKALIGSVLSPKYFLPIIIIYKAVVAGVGAIVKTAKEIMKIFWKLFYYVITKLLWKFISEFWKRIKRDLLLFLIDIAASILTKKKKRYRKMLLALIAILTKIIQDGLNNCKDLYEMINLAIDLALSGIGGALGLGGGGFASTGISPFLLPFFLKKPGYSEDKATINVIEKLEEAGISTAPIFGEPNKIIPFVKAVISGHVEEMDDNSFIAVANKEVVIPVPGLSGPLVIPPGIIVSGGGTF
jgi:gas vesicle protein